VPYATGFRRGAILRVESTQQARATKIHSAMDHANATFASRIHLSGGQKYCPGFVPHPTFLSGEHVAARIIHDPVKNVREDWTTGRVSFPLGTEGWRGILARERLRSWIYVREGLMGLDCRALRSALAGKHGWGCVGMNY